MTSYFGIEIGKTYNGATVVEIAPGADKYSQLVIKFTGWDGSFIGEGGPTHEGKSVHQCSESYFRREFMNKEAGYAK